MAGVCESLVCLYVFANLGLLKEEGVVLSMTYFGILIFLYINCFKFSALKRRTQKLVMRIEEKRVWYICQTISELKMKYDFH